MIEPSAMDVQAVARRLGVSGDTVLRWIRGGKMAAIQLPSGHWRIERADLESFIASRKRPQMDASHARADERTQRPSY